MRAAKCGAVVAASLVLTILTSPPVQAFEVLIHGQITETAL